MDIFEKINIYQNKINELRPFEGDSLTQIKNFYRIGLTWSSNAIEGNTLTENETKILIEDGLTAGGKPLRDTFEAIGHAQAFEYMFYLLNHRAITEKDILMLHRLFYHYIEEQQAGKYRNMQVIITGSKYPVTEVKQIKNSMSELCDWAENSRDSYHPVEYAALLHSRFVRIHPFKDGNGRVARLIMNAALIQDRFLPVIIPPILRHKYIEALEKSHINENNFIEFIAECELESQKEMLRLFNIPLPSTTQK